MMMMVWINDEILTAKRYRRKAERRWRASRSTTDLMSFRLCRNRVTFLMNKARCAYYTNLVSENCLNQRNLFSACKSLLNLSKCASLPLHSNPSQLGHPKTQTMQTADCRLQTVQTVQTVQTEYFFSYPCFCIHF